MQFERLVDEPEGPAVGAGVPVSDEYELPRPSNVNSNDSTEAGGIVTRKLSNGASTAIDFESNKPRERRSSALELGGLESKKVPLIDADEHKEAIDAGAVIINVGDEPQQLDSPGVVKKQEEEKNKGCFAKCKAWAKSLKRSIGIIMIALRNPELPCLVKCIAWFTVIYALSPIDLIPDCIPILGYLDDLIIVPIGIWLTIKLIPKEIWDAAEEEYNRTEHTKPAKDWRGGVIVVVIWIALGVWIGRMIYNKIYE
eukprot:TRINITY_DN138_c0_g1_i2.p1 TRINITY_DN138_c0_g1~~TRINITY_DN138_c0_g1_i2.p1  ORF type:complete len:255 (-),score=76.83 TRINITY_DN138_c0_g1_i2:44-808(-)